MSESMEHVFVYGTLKRGECREACWPIEPAQVREAWTLGKLYDVGPYPALVDGEDCVLGEAWSFPAAQMESVHTTLDEIEGTNQPGEPNYYDRQLCKASLANGLEIEVSLYRFARPELLNDFRYIRPNYRWNQRSCSRWTS